MADVMYTEDPGCNVFEKLKVKNSDNVSGCEKNDRVNDVGFANVKSFYGSCDSDKLFDKLCDGNNRHEGFLSSPSSPCQEDECRKKRCVDRYDSSESSDSGVATLSCTDCSGSSSNSSDITDPGSPFSTASSHSEDSGASSQFPSSKMPPTQIAHAPWPWTTAEDSAVLSLKRQVPEKTATASFKRFKTSSDNTLQAKKSPSCLDNAKKILQLSNDPSSNVEKSAKHNNNNNKSKKSEPSLPRMQQGKITEYFKTHVKPSSLKKDFSMSLKSETKTAKLNKFVSLHENGMKQPVARKNENKANTAAKKSSSEPKTARTVPRKILPAPSKIPDNITVSNMNNLNNLTSFTPTVTLTAVGFPSNLAYLPTKTPKPPDNQIFVQQFTTISPDKLGIINRTPCLNVIQPVQKITTINNFNCVKLNATVVPIVKLNTLPSRLNHATTAAGLANVALSVETGVPTVLSAKPKVSSEYGSCIAEDQVVPRSPAIAVATSNVTPKQPNNVTPTVDSVHTNYRSEEFRSEDQRTQDKCRDSDASRAEVDVGNQVVQARLAEKSPPTPSDSDSGYSNKEVGEIVVVEEPQRSPILTQPKTIRFPARVREEIKKDGKDAKSSRQNECLCRWTECSAQFDTSGALLEHLQEKHVISQATQEQYVCLWKSCKVFGQKSCSRAWLERHVLAHAGKKPFRCIVDGCGQRFNSQLMLERHVNNHFNGDGTQANNAKKSTDNASAKLFKRNGKKIRFRRQPWSARMFDFMDSGIMEGLQHKLLNMTQLRTLGQIKNAGDSISLRSQILARRRCTKGSTEYLVRWHPVDTIPDEWVNEKDYTPTKSVPIPAMESSAKTQLKPVLFPQKEDVVQKKNRRKPVSKAT